MESKNNAGAVVIGKPGRGTTRPARSAVRVFKHVRDGREVTTVLDPLGELSSQLCGYVGRSIGPATREVLIWQRELPSSGGRRSASLASPRWSAGLQGLERTADDRAAALLHVRAISKAIGAAVDEAAGDALARVTSAGTAEDWRKLDEAYAQISGLKSVLVAVDWQLADVHAMWARALREEAKPKPVDEDQLALDASDPDIEAGSLRDAELAEEFSSASRGLNQLEETFDAVWSVFYALVNEHGPLRALGAHGKEER